MRRLGTLLCAAALCLLAAAPAAAGTTLYLYNWNNYISQSTIRQFEQFCSCNVHQDYYGDNEEMLAKLAAGAGTVTLPLQIYSMIKIAVTPEVNAVSTLLMLLTLVLIVVATKVSPSLFRPGEAES
jgi:spermidine/putrescine-binding protein